MPIKEDINSAISAGTESIVLEQPATSDSPSLHQLVDLCKPLDLNSPYCYMILAEHFHGTSIVARFGDIIAGYVSGYLIPERKDTLFVWQVAVHPDFRKKGLADKMIHGILKRPVCAGVAFIETTVTPSNIPSRKLFYHVAQSLETEVSESVIFPAGLFGEGENHEEEVLFRIGPFHDIK